MMRAGVPLSTCASPASQLTNHQRHLSLTLAPCYEHQGEIRCAARPKAPTFKTLVSRRPERLTAAGLDPAYLTPLDNAAAAPAVVSELALNEGVSGTAPCMDAAE